MTVTAETLKYHLCSSLQIDGTHYARCRLLIRDMHEAVLGSVAFQYSDNRISVSLLSFGVCALHSCLEF